MPEDPPVRLTAPRPSAPIHLPTPEEIGLTNAVAAQTGLDWAAAHARLEKLGADCFQLRRLPDGAYRCQCRLPTTQASVTHCVEAVAASEADAVRQALEKAEQWAGVRK
jgi:hypothetical protein